MKFLASFIVAAASVFCAAPFAQEINPGTVPNPVSPVSPAIPDGTASPPVPAPAPVPVPAIPPAPVSPPPPPPPPPAPALPAGPLGRAEMAATAWLAVADAGDYPLSWRQAASLLQVSLPQPKWDSLMQTNRLPLGSVKSRTLKSATFSRTLTGAPDGEYLMIQYETQFEFRPQAIETLTTMKDRDNSWKVAGYFIK